MRKVEVRGRGRQGGGVAPECGSAGRAWTRGSPPGTARARGGRGQSGRRVARAPGGHGAPGEQPGAPEEPLRQPLGPAATRGGPRGGRAARGERRRRRRHRRLRPAAARGAVRRGAGAGRAAPVAPDGAGGGPRGGGGLGAPPWRTPRGGSRLAPGRRRRRGDGRRPRVRRTGAAAAVPGLRAHVQPQGVRPARQDLQEGLPGEAEGVRLPVGAPGRDWGKPGGARGARRDFRRLPPGGGRARARARQAGGRPILLLLLLRLRLRLRVVLRNRPSGRRGASSSAPRCGRRGTRGPRRHLLARTPPSCPAPTAAGASTRRRPSATSPSARRSRPSPRCCAGDRDGRGGWGAARRRPAGPAGRRAGGCGDRCPRSLPAQCAVNINDMRKRRRQSRRRRRPPVRLTVPRARRGRAGGALRPGRR